MRTYPDIRLRKSLDTQKNDLFEVCEDCRCELMCGLVLVIPKGYRTDFASVPQWLWAVIPPHGRMANAAVLHDYMYDSRWMESSLGADLARQLADTVFLKNMLADGVPPFQARLYYRAVRWFGGSWWRN